MYICMYIYIYMYIQICIYVYVYVCVNAYAYVYVYVDVYVYVYVYIKCKHNMYIYIPALKLSKPLQVTDLSHYRWAAQTGARGSPSSCQVPRLAFKEMAKRSLGKPIRAHEQLRENETFALGETQTCFSNYLFDSNLTLRIVFIANLLWLLASVQPGYAKVEFTVAVQSKFTIWPHTDANHRRSLLHKITFPSAVFVRHHICNTYCLHICNFFLKIHVKNYIQ